MQNLPLWVWTGIIGLIVGGTLVGTVIVQISPDKGSSGVSTSSTSVPTESTKESNNNSAIIIVKDSKTNLPLEDVSLYLVTKQGTISEKTNSLGTYKFQVPPQELGEVYIDFTKEGYKSGNRIPVNFLINSNIPKTINLEPKSEFTEQKKSTNTNSNYQVDIKPNKEVYAQQELIRVQYSITGVPKKYTQWMTIVEPSRPVGQSGRYQWIAKNGTIEFGGYDEGNYEIRVHIRDGNGFESLLGRKSIKVE